MGLSDNMQPATWAISIPFIVITGITCLLRFYSRLYISKSFGADDWFMVAASVGVHNPFQPSNLTLKFLLSRYHGSLQKGSYVR